MERKVDMVRLERQEEYYEREEIFGRDVSSVFPKQADTSNKAGATDADAMKEALGARRFISETELEAFKSSRGLCADDGSATVLKPLVEVLREAKERKETEFQNKWKQMKQGKNRPLDPEELAFMDKLLDDEAEKERQQRLFEQQELDEYRRALQEANEPESVSGPDPQARSSKVDAPPLLKRPQVAAKPAVKPSIRVKPKAPAQGTVAMEAAGRKPPVQPQGSADGEEHARKKAKTCSTVPEQQCEGEGKASREGSDDEGGGGLAGLLGGYGSD